ncbi:OmpH family outer membrane protein [Oceanicola sp. S124]|uniref:OmpH family outer membrane protein n=1 Tax=Oceanicola sp. S124 TaxID=1042378 RepID=UPI00025578E9|nr:OmpH family outer membrane protein [Oceanicola sp. S124]
MFAASLVIAGLAGSVAAQDAVADVVPRTPVLVVDSERLFSDSAFGQQLADRIEQAATEIAAENRRIEAALAEEEQALTDRRPTMTPDEFRAMADAFDEKVTRIRRERDEAAAGLGEDSDAVRRQFLVAVEPVLYGLMQEAGSAVILERRTVFVTREVVDVTDEAIQRIDTQLLQPQDPVAGQGDAPADPADPADPAAPEAAPAETGNAAGGDAPSGE